MTAEILSVGTELLLGNIVNTNAQYISERLSLAGINVYYQSVCGDNAQRLRGAVETALSRSDIIITTGGLGPTYDDITKEVAADCLGLPLTLDEESLARMRAFFRRIGREMTENNIKQAYVPEGSAVLQNDHGTAPGVMVEKGGKTLIMLPGPPREMKPMFDRFVLPKLTAREERVLSSANVHLYGIGESTAEALLPSSLKESANPTVAPYAKEGEMIFRVTAAAANEKEAREMLAEPVEVLKRNFGEYIYGIDINNLWAAAFQALRAKKLTVASAESCTGGMLSELLTSIPGSSEVFECGVVSYSNEIKQKLLSVSPLTLKNHGAVSAQTAEEMARGARRLSGADIGIGITGIAGPGGGSEEKPAGTVFVAAVSEWDLRVNKLLIGRGGGERELVRRCACLEAFNLVRLLAQEY